METIHYIAAQDFCREHQIELGFIHSLNEYGIIEVLYEQETIFIHPDQLKLAEQCLRWHYELDINLEGIDVIRQLLLRVENMQDEITQLKNKLQQYESGS